MANEQQQEPPKAPAQTFFFSLHQVLVALDLSPLSLSAFRWASWLAHRAQAEVTVVNVLRPMPMHAEQVIFPYAALGGDRHELEAELLDAARVAVLGATDRIREELEVQSEEIYAHFFHGSPVERLKGSISQTNSDLVLCGLTGDSAMVPGQIGGVAHKLLATALRPTLGLRAAASSAPRLRRILVAFDGSEGSSALLNWAISLAVWFDADVELASIIPEPYRDDPCGLFAQSRTRLPPKMEESARTRLTQALERAKERLYIPFPLADKVKAMSLTQHIHVADPLAGLLALIDERQIDLVVFGSRHPKNPYLSCFGRVADGLARRAGCHCMVVPVELLISNSSDHP